MLGLNLVHVSKRGDSLFSWSAAKNNQGDTGQLFPHISHLRKKDNLLVTKWHHKTDNTPFTGGTTELQMKHNHKR